jgi:hypothetical protein
MNLTVTIITLAKSTVDTVNANNVALAREWQQLLQQAVDTRHAKQGGQVDVIKQPL